MKKISELNLRDQAKVVGRSVYIFKDKEGRTIPLWVNKEGRVYIQILEPPVQPKSVTIRDESYSLVLIGQWFEVVKVEESRDYTSEIVLPGPYYIRYVEERRGQGLFEVMNFCEGDLPEFHPTRVVELVVNFS